MCSLTSVLNLCVYYKVFKLDDMHHKLILNINKKKAKNYLSNIYKIMVNVKRKPILKLKQCV